MQTEPVLRDYGHQFRYVEFTPGTARDVYLERATALRAAFFARTITAGEYAREMCLAVDAYVLAVGPR